MGQERPLFASDIEECWRNKTKPRKMSNSERLVVGNHYSSQDMPEYVGKCVKMSNSESLVVGDHYSSQDMPENVGKCLKMSNSESLVVGDHYPGQRESLPR